jgi:hypothetical protein
MTLRIMGMGVPISNEKPLQSVKDTPRYSVIAGLELLSGRMKSIDSSYLKIGISWWVSFTPGPRAFVILCWRQRSLAGIVCNNICCEFH